MMNTKISKYGFINELMDINGFTKKLLFYLCSYLCTVLILEKINSKRHTKDSWIPCRNCFVYRIMFICITLFFLIRNSKPNNLAFF